MHERQLGLVHEDPRLGELGQHDRVAGADHRVGVLQEHVERRGPRARVLPVVGDAARILPGRGSGGRSRTSASGRASAVARQPLERRAQRLETIDDALHRALRRPRRGTTELMSTTPVVRQDRGPELIAAGSENRASFIPRS